MSFEYLLPYESVPQKFIVKAEEPINQEYGFNPLKRPLAHHINFGIVNLDKPAGPTSHEVSSWVKKVLQIEKTGHGGTLDPQVTGLLPVALGDATKVIGALLSAGKEYICVMYLHDEIEEPMVKRALNLMTTEIYQRPPVKSSVKRRLRSRTIYYTQFIEMNGQFVLFRVGCEAGTYIRKLCYDIGEILLCGAHMAELRRTRTGDFREDNSLVSLQDLNDAMKIYLEEDKEHFLRKCILPIERAVQHWKKIFIRDSAVNAIAHGAQLAVQGVLYLSNNIEKGEEIALMTQKGELVGFAIALMSSRKIIETNHGFCTKTRKVFYPRNVYPSWKQKIVEKTDMESENLNE